MTSLFVNRKEELKQLTGLFNDVEKGIPRFVFISGESGVGKALLVEKFLEDNPTKSIFSHYATTVRKNRPYAPYLALIEYLDKEISNETSKKLINELQLLLKKKSGNLGNVKKERDALFDTVYKLLAAVSKDQVLMIFFDNFHMYDDGSILLTQHLALNLENRKIMFLATYRPEALEDDETGMHPVAELLAELMMVDKLRTFQVERFDEESSAELISKILELDELPPGLLSFIMEETEGSPMFISEMLKTILDDKNVDIKIVNWFENIDKDKIKMPGGIQEAIIRRLRTVDRESQNILGYASVLGNEFKISELSELVETDSSTLSKIMSGLVEHKLVFELYDRDEETYNFDHSKIREVLYDQVPPKKRMRLHGTAGNLLLKKGSEDHYSLAYHFTAAKDIENGVKYSVLAADLALGSHAPNEAYRHYAAASNLISQSKADNEMRLKQIELLNKMGELDYIIGEWDRGISNHRKAHKQALELGDKKAIVDSLAKLGEILKFRGENEMALEAFKNVLSISKEEGFEDGLAIGYKGIGYIQWRSGEFDEALKNYESCINSASKTVHMKTLGVAHIEMGNVLSSKGDLKEAQRHYRDAIEILQELEEFSELSRAYNNLGDTFLQLKDWDTAIDNFKESGDIAEKIGYTDMIAWSQFNRAEAYSKKGDLDMALNFCNMALPLLRKLDDKVGLSGLHKNLGIIYRFKKNWKESEKHFILSKDLDKELNTPVSLIECYLEEGLMFIDKGDTKMAERKLKKGLDLAKKIDAMDYLKRVEKILGSIGE